MSLQRCIFCNTNLSPYNQDREDVPGGWTMVQYIGDKYYPACLKHEGVKNCLVQEANRDNVRLASPDETDEQKIIAVLIRRRTRRVTEKSQA